ncbi:MAG TPA: Asp-tRNA(Asn)/Glu-tRNA(Gln) amidotransferase subunit GatA [Armatimonadota bacterium]|nr:Asp-tRNA(Asn)/Glu-tRNA(Gln) amidotransferase subunit GatA [Armatimonadota bacterium]HOM81626.1 Asp-tRNA(Asn)/Glu-tRNA(Gln) amidotransferase subunit GatA [Armatimonadota bacterium]HPO72361.1 Asp-tRNA(Asn)/Glu-tRNA(Gln) amidotransferase subunit GatA [Armatimonadota bacterium]
MPELHMLTAHELAELLRRGEVSAVEIAEDTLDRISAVEERVKSYVTVAAEEALEQARAVDERRARGEALPPLAGIPIALKDNLCTRGIRTTCSSRILENWVPPYDATVVKRLRDQQAVFIGKTNMDEFAMGSSTEYSAFHVTRNPWDLSRVPGGSSGGSAAAVAAREATLSLGSDTGGSIRQPASFCGVVGLKPTYGRVSRYGLVAFASSLDQIGPVARDVTDAALLLQAISGHDPNDATSATAEVPDYTKALRSDVKGLKLGVPRELWTQGVDPAVNAAVRAAVDRLVELGAEAEEVSMPHIDYSFPVFYLIAPSEASSNLARYDGVRYGLRVPADDPNTMMERTRDAGFGPEVKQRIVIGTFALSAGYYDAYYLKALKVRTLVKQDFDRAFERYDLLVSPVSPTVAFGIGEKTGDPLQMKLADVCTIPINLAGIPAISVPCGFYEGLPIGLQIMGKPFGEETLLRAAYAYEQSTDWHRRTPEV